MCLLLIFFHINCLLSFPSRWLDEYQDDGKIERELLAESSYNAVGEAGSVALWESQLGSIAVLWLQKSIELTLIICFPFSCSGANLWGGSLCARHNYCFEKLQELGEVPVNTWPRSACIWSTHIISSFSAASCFAPLPPLLPPPPLPPLLHSATSF